MSANVNKMVGEAMDKIKSIITEAVQKTDTAARSELLAQFNRAIGSASSNGTTAAPVKRGPGRPRKNPVVETAAPVKRKPGRPRKNPQPEAAAAPKAKKVKAKRVLSEDARKKLAENLRKAREAKAAKSKPAKRKAKSESTETAAAPAQA